MTDASTFNEVASGVESIVTAVGILVGGVWVYFRFIKDRAYRPRLQLDLAVRTFRRDETVLGIVTLSATNIGSSKVRIDQKGSAVSVWLPSAPLQKHKLPSWSAVFGAAVFEHHEWIESQESAVDEVLVPLGALTEGCVRAEARLVVPRGKWRSRISFHTARTAPVGVELQALPENATHES